MCFIHQQTNYLHELLVSYKQKNGRLNKRRPF